MSQRSQKAYGFGPYHLDAARRRLRRDGELVQITPKAFDILLELIEGRGEIVDKDDLMKRVWPDSFVEDGNLTYNISMLRKALGERTGEHQYIVTVPGRGYQFVEKVKELTSESEDTVATGHASADSVSLETAVRSQDETALGEVDQARTLDAPVINPQVQHKRRLPIAAILLTAAAGVSILGYLVGWKQSKARPEETFGTMNMVRLTTDGATRAVAISPDGNYMSHAIVARGEQSLWLRHIATGSDTELIPRARVVYRVLSF